MSNYSKDLGKAEHINQESLVTPILNIQRLFETDANN